MGQTSRPSRAASAPRPISVPRMLSRRCAAERRTSRGTSSKAILMPAPTCNVPFALLVGSAADSLRWFHGLERKSRSGRTRKCARHDRVLGLPDRQAEEEERSRHLPDAEVMAAGRQVARVGLIDRAVHREKAEGAVVDQTLDQRRASITLQL